MSTVYSRRGMRLRLRCRRVDDPLVSELPDAYRRLLVLLGRGESDEAIAAALGVPAEALPGMRLMAHRKLARLRRAAAPKPAAAGP